MRSKKVHPDEKINNDQKLQEALDKIGKILKDSDIEPSTIAMMKNGRMSFFYTGDIYMAARLASTMANKLQIEVNKSISKGLS